MGLFDLLLSGGLLTGFFGLFGLLLSLGFQLRLLCLFQADGFLACGLGALLLLSQCFAARGLLPGEFLAFRFQAGGFDFGGLFGAGGFLAELFLSRGFALRCRHQFCLPQVFEALLFLFDSGLLECGAFLRWLFDWIWGGVAGDAGGR